MRIKHIPIIFQDLDCVICLTALLTSFCISSWLVGTEAQLIVGTEAQLIVSADALPDPEI